MDSRSLRLWHLYLGCFFAPLLIYFSVSGAWQLFRFNDLPKGEPPTTARTFMHELSKPHTHSTLPGGNPRGEKSALFNWLALVMAAGITFTSLMGIAIAFQMTKRRLAALACLVAGAAVPVLLLLLR